MRWSSPGSALRSAVTVSERTVLLHVAGELDYGSVSAFEALLERVRFRAANRLTLDLSRLTFCDVPGARAIYRQYLRLAELGIRLDIANPHSSVRYVMQATGLPYPWDFGLAVAAEDAAQAHVETLSDALAQAMRATGARMGSAQYFHQATGTLRLVATPGFGQRFSSFFETVRGYGTSCGAAATDQRPVYVRNVSNSPIFAGSPELEVLIRSGVGSCVSIPVVTADGLLGVVSTHQPVSEEWRGDPEELTAESLADLAL
ncbi:STAS domain-containing protein [Actinospica robiniae]|uniref:STAS domain-containing protein n=1 Tax=Actinospica robiniae TaxID=304901 RepID=UPI00146FAA2D|nr:STAS domain-containing protein [Actinospica robiniae]